MSGNPTSLRLGSAELARAERLAELPAFRSTHSVLVEAVARGLDVLDAEHGPDAGDGAALAAVRRALSDLRSLGRADLAPLVAGLDAYADSLSRSHGGPDAGR